MSPSSDSSYICPGVDKNKKLAQKKSKKTTTLDASDGQYGRFGGSPVASQSLAQPRCQQNDEGHWVMMPDVCLSCRSMRGGRTVANLGQVAGDMVSGAFGR
jgi:hypothetical protein